MYTEVFKLGSAELSILYLHNAVTRSYTYDQHPNFKEYKHLEGYGLIEKAGTLFKSAEAYSITHYGKRLLNKIDEMAEHAGKKEYPLKVELDNPEKNYSIVFIIEPDFLEPIR